MFFTWNWLLLCFLHRASLRGPRRGRACNASHIEHRCAGACISASALPLNVPRQTERMEAVSPPAASFWHRCTMQEFLGPQPCGQSLCACRRNTCPRLQASGTENCGTEGMSGQERSVGVLRQEAIFPDQLPVKRASSKRSAFSSFDRLHYRGKNSFSRML